MYVLTNQAKGPTHRRTLRTTQSCVCQCECECERERDEGVGHSLKKLSPHKSVALLCVGAQGLEFDDDNINLTVLLLSILVSLKCISGSNGARILTCLSMRAYCRYIGVDTVLSC